MTNKIPVTKQSLLKSQITKSNDSVYETITITITITYSRGNV